MPHRSRRQPRSDAGTTAGRVVLIGGNEDKTGPCDILVQVVRRVGSGTLVVATLASQEPDRQWERYSRVFKRLGLDRVRHLSFVDREEATDPARLRLFDDATAVFFTGGDQVKITAKLGGTALFTRIRDLYERGGLIAGTSAGAAAMGDAMLVSETTIEESHKVGGAFYMARGLGLVHELIVDQHFAQRARIERLVGAVAENPAVLAVGIDEDTAVILDGPGSFIVAGSGAVYVADGHAVTYTNASEQAVGHTLALFDLRLHVLNRQNGFDIKERRPYVAKGGPGL